MNDLQTVGPVPRSLFLSGHAECRRCGSHVRPSAATSALVRVGKASSATAWCSVCCTTASYDLEPQRSPSLTTTA